MRCVSIVLLLFRQEVMVVLAGGTLVPRTGPGGVERGGALYSLIFLQEAPLVLLAVAER